MEGFHSATSSLTLDDLSPDAAADQGSGWGSGARPPCLPGSPARRCLQACKAPCPLAFRRSLPFACKACTLIAAPSCATWDCRPQLR